MRKNSTFALLILVVVIVSFSLFYKFNKSDYQETKEIINTPVAHTSTSTNNTVIKKESNVKSDTKSDTINNKSNNVSDKTLNKEIVKEEINTQKTFETKIVAFVTGYTYWDNTPPGSAQISHPIIHEEAGGTGTYADPITVAVGHIIENGTSTLDFPSGTRFYIPNLRKYFIVEDTCGDGPTPQNGPCHTGYPKGTTAWVDIWIDGATGSEELTNSCAEKVTGNHLIIKDPATNYSVVSGPVFNNGSCASEFGDTPVTISQ